VKEWWIWFERIDTFEEETLIVLPTFRKVLLWFLLNAWKCTHIEIVIQYVGGANE